MTITTVLRSDGTASVHNAEAQVTIHVEPSKDGQIRLTVIATTHSQLKRLILGLARLYDLTRFIDVQFDDKLWCATGKLIGRSPN